MPPPAAHTGSGPADPEWHTLSVRLSDADYQSVAESAWRQRLSVSALVRQLLREQLREGHPPAAAPSAK